MKKEINYHSLFESLPRVTGLPWVRKGRKYYGSFYLDGTKHPRRDKSVAYMKGDKIVLVEQGKGTQDLWQLFSDRGITDKEVGDFLRSESDSNFVPPPFVEPEVKYVFRSSMDKTLGLHSDNLFIWLCSLFPRKDVIQTYNLYNVGSMYNGNTCFWMIDEKQNICHDKIMTYDPKTGSRDKGRYGNGRRFQYDFGFTSTPAFGDHLLDKFHGQKIYCVESEKTALLFYLTYKKLCIATSGSSCLYKAKPNHTLLGDYDKAGENWYNSGGVNWWDHYDEKVEDGDDIGDILVKKRLKILAG